MPGRTTVLHSLGSLIRAALLSVPVFCLWWRYAAARDFTSALLLGSFVVLMGIGVIADLRHRPNGRGPLRRFLSSAVRWLFALAVCTTGFSLGLGPVDADHSAPIVAPFWRPDGSIGYPYEGELTSDGRYLFVAQTRTDRPGVTRFDLTTGEVQSFRYDDRDAVYLTLDEPRNRGFVTRNTAQFFSEPSPTVLHPFQLEPFQLLPEERLAIGGITNAFPIESGTLVYLKTLRRSGGVLLFGPSSAPAQASAFEELPLPGTYLHLEGMVKEIDSNYAWFNAEFGTDIARVDLEARRVDRHFSVGLSTWRLAHDAARRRIYASRILQHRIDALDVETGAVVASYPIRGVPRGLMMDPDGTRLYVGVYWSSRIAVIDLTESRVLGYLKVGARPRRLIWRGVGGEQELIVFCEDGLFRIPAATLRQPIGAVRRN